MARQWKKQASVAYGYALARLALNCFMYFDRENTGGEDGSAGTSPVCQKETDQIFCGLLDKLLEGTLERGMAGELREMLRHEMDTVIAYTDAVKNYEYALNRVERRFDSSLPVSDKTEEEFVNQTMGFLTAAGDAASMNRRIQEVIGQLPVRFTKMKFYSMVRDALSAYIGADQEALDNVMYFLNTSAMTELTEERRKEFPELKEILEMLEGLRFRELTAESYKNASQAVVLAGEKLFELSENCQTMTEMVNDLYLISITKDDAVRDAFLEDTVFGMIRGLVDLHGKEITEDLEQMLCKLEGVQEEYYEKYSRLDPAPEYQEGEDAQNSVSRCVDRLMSTSIFVSLEEHHDRKLVDRQDIDRVMDNYIAVTEPVFTKCQKPVLRAVMATTLSALPVCFNSLDEIQSYIAESLGSCSDLAEKETCKELILQLMEMEDYEVV